MAFKLVVLLATLAYANAGYLGAQIAAPAVAYSAAPAVSHVSYSSPLVSYGTPTLTSQHQNILRSPGNLQQISTFSKTIDTPYSSVSKSDVRVSNPGLAYAAAPAYSYAAAPAYSYAAAAPVVTKTIATAPALTYARTIAGPAVSYAAPSVSYAAPSVSYAAPSVSYAAPALSYASAPVLTKTAYAAPALAGPAVAGHGLLGVAYSAAPAVSHMTYSNGLGLSYGW